MFINYEIKLYNGFCESEEIKKFVIKNHYLKSLARGCKFVCALYIDSKLYGVAGFGTPVDQRCQAKYSNGFGKVLELKRFVLKRKAEKNAASWFMAKCINDLKKNKEIESILSYADPKEGYKGTIYKASNFEYLGVQIAASKAVYYKGKYYHTRNAYQDSKIGQEIQKKLISKKLKAKELPKKHIFLYNLRK